jgi:hypothetical protein
MFVAGLVNRHDMVGRCFMKHPHPNAVRALVTDAAMLAFYTHGLRHRAAARPEVLGCLN